MNLPFVASLSRIFSPFVVLEHHVVSLLMATVEAKRVCLPKRRNGARCGSCFTYSTRQSHQRLGRRRCGAQNFGTCSMDVSVTVQPGISDLVHDDLVTELAVRVKQVITASSPSSNESSCRIASRKLRRLQKSLAAIASIVSDTSLLCVICAYFINTRRGQTTSTEISSRLEMTCIGRNSMMTTHSSSFRKSNSVLNGINQVEENWAFSFFVMNAVVSGKSVFIALKLLVLYIGCLISL